MTSTTSITQEDTNLKKIDLHQQVTNTIIRQLEAGTIPWHCPWQGEDFRLPGMPKNSTNGNKYRGVNILLLWGSTIEQQYTSAEWATFNQWNSQKEQIRKGEKGTRIVKYDIQEKEVDGESVKIPFVKYFTVFNRCQLVSHTETEQVQPVEQLSLVERIDVVDEFIEHTHAIVQHIGSSAHYHRVDDIIYMPDANKFIASDTCTATEGYYSTLLHELTHWTGAEKRLNRTKGKVFGDENYAQEELTAELGAAFLCAEFDITTADKGDHASYIDHWLQVLKNDKHCVFKAASQASKAVDYLMGIQPTYILE